MTYLFVQLVYIEYQLYTNFKSRNTSYIAKYFFTKIDIYIYIDFFLLKHAFKKIYMDVLY